MNFIKRDNLNTIEEVIRRNLGIDDLSVIDKWTDDFYHRRSYIPNLCEAVKLLRAHKNDHITIVGDYDADGITSTSILYLALISLSYDVSYRIPKRFTEGYGLNPAIIDEIDSGFVITVDNGIASFDAIKKAKDKDLSVIILDHHLPKKDASGQALVPPADVIVDNFVNEDAGFIPYCGAGLALRFVMELGINADLFRSLIPHAAIGTVADVVPLRSENYVIVREGMKIMNEDPGALSIGLAALLKRAHFAGDITSEAIGFRIAPVLNAQSRMEDEGAVRSLQLLTASDSSEADALSEVMISVNDDRKEARYYADKKAEKQIVDEGLDKECPIVLNIPDIGDGIIGLVAGSIAEKYSRPCICFTNSENGLLKGSARSGSPLYDMKEHLDMVSSYLSAYGGHKGAAGLSLRADNFSGFKKAVIEASKDFTPSPLDNIYYDLNIREDEIPAVSEIISRYEPYGNENSEILFHVENYSVIPAAGKYGSLFQKSPEGEYLSIKYTGRNSCALGYGMADLPEAKRMELIGTVSRGNITIVSMRPLKDEKKLTPMQERLLRYKTGA